MSRTHTPFPNDRLSRWHFAVQHAVFRLKQQIVTNETQGNDTEYDMRQLEQLQDLDMFLSMSWDAWLDELCTNLPAETNRINETAECADHV